MQGKKMTKREQDMLDKIAELTEDLKRTQADFMNFRRRAEEEQQSSVAYGKQSAIIELLPVMDNISRALAYVPQDLAEHDYVKGIQAVVKQLDGALNKLGLERIEVLGKDFDPQTMDAVHMEDGDGDREVVVEELQAGYTLNGAVVRHAVVKVARQ